jgi:hypothetical protein
LGIGLAVVVSAVILSGCNDLNKDEAKRILLTSDSDLEKTIIVDTGYLNSRCGQSPTSGKYALLEKAGILSIGSTGTSTEVLTTSKGDQVLKQVGAHRLDTSNLKAQLGQGNCNVQNWVIPIASKDMLAMTVTPAGDNAADVIYNWKWNPNEVGQNFAADSHIYRSLSRHLQESIGDSDIPLDNSYTHATKVHFYHDGVGWHMKEQGK